MLVDTITPGPKKNLSSSRIKPPLSLGPTLQKGERRVGKGSRLDTVPDGKGKVKAQSDWSLRPIPVELGQIPVDTPKEIREVLKRAVAHCKAMRAPDAGKDHDNNPFRRANAITPTKVYDQSNSSGSTVNDSSTFGSSPTTSTTRTSIESNQQAIANETSHNTVSGTSASSDGSRSKPLDKQSSSRTPTITDSSSPFPIRKKRSTIFGRLWSTQTRAGDSRTNLAPGPSELLGKTSKTQECASCFEDVPRSTAMSLVCRHSYCRECLNRLVETAFQNENLWPPRCCLLDIPRPVIRKCLQAKNIAMFTWKEKEFSVPIQDRWYCTSSKCGRWFDPKVKRSSAKVECPHCRFKMCSHCRAEVHPVTISCPEDRGLRATIDTARREGYQRCYNCHTMVELKEGCQHITCSCKAHFWYVYLCDIKIGGDTN